MEIKTGKRLIDQVCLVLPSPIAEALRNDHRMLTEDNAKAGELERALEGARETVELQGAEIELLSKDRYREQCLHEKAREQLRVMLIERDDLVAELREMRESMKAMPPHRTPELPPSGILREKHFLAERVVDLCRAIVRCLSPEPGCRINMEAIQAYAEELPRQVDRVADLHAEDDREFRRMMESPKT